MQPHPYDCFTETGGSGRLIFTPCPGTKDAALADALLTLREAGATALITLMPDEELSQNSVTSLPAQCQALGIEWFQLPVADESVPGADFDERWQQHLPRILALLDADQAIAIHCKGGSGRTGLIAARILMARGVPLTEAVSQVQTLRPQAICHPAHVKYLNSLGG